MKVKVFSLLLVLMMMVGITQAQESVTLTLITHDSLNVSEDVLAAFTDETGINVEILRMNDAGTLINQSILTRDVPLGDVLFGVDNTFLSRALDGEIFIPYESPLLENVPEAFQIDETYHVTPVDYGDVCLNYDVAYFDENALDVPESLADLTDEAYDGLLVVTNPATSSPGLAFLMATVAVFGEEGEYTYLDFWQDLVANDVLVVDDWSSAYYNEFSGSAGSVGTRPLVLSYASSPPVEVYYMETPPERAPTGVIAADETCFRQIEFAGILHGTQHEAEAQQFIDFLLSADFQEDLPLQMFVYPVVEDTVLPEVFEEYSVVAETPVDVAYEDIEAFREAWILAWTEAVLR